MDAMPWGTAGARDRWDDWHWQCANRIRTVSDLVERIGIGRDLEQRYAELLTIYPYAVTPYYLSLMHRDDPDDPIRLQCIPDVKELEFGPDERDDPLAEQQHEKVPGLLHRFPDRALVITTDRCAVYCRHCMRKRLWRARRGDRSNEELLRMVDYIRTHPEIREVIVSGGDPLMLPTERIDRLLGALRAIPHVEVVRVGSRIPVVMPMRIDEELCRTLEKYRPLWFVTHFNHPREVSPEAARACDLLLRRGIPVSNQSVLLRGVNDSLEVMRELCQALQRISVRPYYVFQCDPVRGTGHFRTPVRAGVAIATALRATSSGLCVPTFMVDTPGRDGKIPLEAYRLEGEPPRAVP
jgi:lysine 2,3-aminomutase